MRRIVAVSVALLVAVPANANNAVGKTYLTNRDVFQATSPERVTLDRNNRLYTQEEDKATDLSATVIYVKSQDEQNLRDYFLPVIGQTSLIAGELYSAANQTNPLTLNVVANYFNVFTQAFTGAAGIGYTGLTFQSTLAFNPKQTMAGVGLQWQQSFRKYFFKASAPIVHISNDLGMVETVTNVGGGAVPTGAVANMTDAFKQPLLLYGKIDGAQEKWGVADVELIFGREWFGDQICQMAAYIGAVVPTGNRPKAEHLWEAVVGNNHHWGAFFGSSSSYVWREGDNYVMTAYCDTDARYLFENTQTRMLDLQGRPWSRYLWLAEYNTTPNSFLLPGSPTPFDGFLTPGVNVTTQKVRVAPHSSFSITSALNYRRDGGLELEGGINFYARQDEKVKLLNAFVNDNNYCIPSFMADADSADANVSLTASFATINNTQGFNFDQDVDSNPLPVLLTEADLDLNSASTPAVLESTIYASLGKNWNECRYPAFLGIGGGYTYNSNNSSIRRWGVWGKTGVTF